MDSVFVGFQLPCKAISFLATYCSLLHWRYWQIPYLVWPRVKKFSLIMRICAKNEVHTVSVDTEASAALPLIDPVAKDYLLLFQRIGHLSDY